MPYREQQLLNNEIYHVILRGLDDNLIFKDTDDYYRGIFSIYEFNNAIPVNIWKRRKQRIKEKAGLGPTSPARELLVDILAFCFMPNHIHLLLRQRIDNGITKFMTKVGTGYGGYFNRKYNRKGYVFQNRFLSVLIEDDNQLKVVFVYIHSNPISLIEPNWKEEGIENPEEVIHFLENFKWSSYSDYIGRETFPSVIEREFILKVIDGEDRCKEFVEDWIKYKKELRKFDNKFRDIILE